MFEGYPDIMEALQVAKAHRIGQRSDNNLTNSKSLTSTSRYCHFRPQEMPIRLLRKGYISKR